MTSGIFLSGNSFGFKQVCSRRDWTRGARCVTVQRRFNKIQNLGWTLMKLQPERERDQPPPFIIRTFLTTVWWPGIKTHTSLISWILKTLSVCEEFLSNVRQPEKTPVICFRHGTAEDFSPWENEWDVTHDTMCLINWSHFYYWSDKHWNINAYTLPHTQHTDTHSHTFKV